MLCGRSKTDQKQIGQEGQQMCISDNANNSSMWSSPKIFYLYNNAFDKHWGNGFFDIIAAALRGDSFIHNLPTVHTTNINRFNKRKWFHTHFKKRWEQEIDNILSETIIYADDLALLVNTPTQTESNYLAKRKQTILHVLIKREPSSH